MPDNGINHGRLAFGDCARRPASMYREKLVAIAIISVFLLTGCPAPYTTVERFVDTSSPADFHCLLEQLRELADGRAVTYSVQDLSSGTAHSLQYIHAGSYYGWSMLVRSNHAVTITHGSGVKDSRPQDLPVVWNRLLEVEAAVKNQCGLGEVMDAARVSCRGKACSSDYWPPDNALQQSRTDNEQVITTGFSWR